MGVRRDINCIVVKFNKTNKANCAIYGYFTNRKNVEYKGISLFKIPGGEWSIITRGRMIDQSLREIDSKPNTHMHIFEKYDIFTQSVF